MAVEQKLPWPHGFNLHRRRRHKGQHRAVLGHCSCRYLTKTKNSQGVFTCQTPRFPPQSITPRRSLADHNRDIADFIWMINVNRDVTDMTTIRLSHDRIKFMPAIRH
ncbi:MAG: hypothetical protein A3G18_08675 [Rhodospirillales bacterium RIFCSPLOWO2_12_FULL_58_28]|nr:MAG: hypothetical protein A3H92_00230 [Rhodospirillales bacterium RIFCSPLOWO2_02_FULL_58_16]OHC79771.1 MAG: hypothetical protein A3G18_08675 [Rhodospirillales bacterium RIFCSPLOWO2_12_FULL_58_28]